MCDDLSKKPGKMSQEEYDEFCDEQVKPIKRLISAYEAELSAANAKTWTYGIASVMTTVGMILEIVAASTAKAKLLKKIGLIKKSNTMYCRNCCCKCNCIGMCYSFNRTASPETLTMD